MIEAILSLALTILLLSGVFSFYMGVLRAREEGTLATRDLKLCRALLDQMAEEIRQVTDIVPGDGIGFQGDRHKITIVKVGMPERYAYDEHDLMKDQLPPAQSDIRRITYELLWDQEDRKDSEGVTACYGLFRSEQKTFDPNPRFNVVQEQVPGEEEQPAMAGPQPEGELVAPEIKFLELRYFDGAKWQPRWQFADEDNPEGDSGGAGGDLGSLAGLGELGGGKKGKGAKSSGGYALPQAVRITIGMVRVPPEDDKFTFEELDEMENRRDLEKYHPDRLTVVVPIEQADPTLLSSRQYGVSDSMSRQEGGSK